MSNTERTPLVAVVGPTASGKTALAVELAKALDGEVLSFDSMQLYKGMDVATAKPTADEMQGIPHHLIDVVDPSENYSVARFQEDAARIIADIRGRGKNVILVGGTGLYLDSFIENLQFFDTGDNTPRSAPVSEGNSSPRVLRRCTPGCRASTPNTRKASTRTIREESFEPLKFMN